MQCGHYHRNAMVGLETGDVDATTGLRSDSRQGKDEEKKGLKNDTCDVGITTGSQQSDLRRAMWTLPPDCGRTQAKRRMKISKEGARE
jgi:hypothetical protein